MQKNTLTNKQLESKTLITKFFLLLSLTECISTCGYSLCSAPRPMLGVKMWFHKKSFKSNLSLESHIYSNLHCIGQDINMLRRRRVKRQLKYYPQELWNFGFSNSSFLWNQYTMQICTKLRFQRHSARMFLQGFSR